MTEDKAFAAPEMRRIGKPRDPRPEGERVSFESRAGSIARLSELQGAVNRRPISWPASLKKLKGEAPEIRHAVLYDSRDGVLIATDDFLGFIQARSHFHLKVSVVADHNKASYGNWNQEELFQIVVDGMVFSAMLGPDVISLVCNSACTVDLLGKVKSIVEKYLRDAGKSCHVDMIATVSVAIVEEGGPRPVLLATETTARSGKYRDAVKQAAHEHGIEEPDVVGIGCGDKEARPNHDLAHLINIGAHLQPGSPDFLVLKREIYRYVELIP
ncbi:MAG: hypothetical protein ABWY05_10760 [Noviherbaspirillum sp.]